MLGRKFAYRGLDLTDGVQSDIVLIDNVRNIPLRTQLYNRANYHGTYTSSTLAGGRLFIFRGQIFGETKAERRAGRKKLIDVIQPEPNPNAYNRGFYELTWETDGGIEMTTMAKVYQAPEATNGLDDPIIEFTFSLYAESEKVYEPTQKTASGGIGFFIGTPLSTPLPTPFSGYAGAISCTNEGNRPAPIKVNVVGSCDNPRIINTTNSQKYYIGNGSNPYTSTNLVYDNRNLDNSPTEQLIVTDQGTNIKQYRTQGGDIFLEPGENHLVVLADDYPNSSSVTITWRDSYFLT